MKVKDVIALIEKDIAPLALAEKWDSPGLKTGSGDTEISKILVCLDVTNAVVAEAIGLSAVKKDASGQHCYGKLSGLVPLEEFAAALKSKLSTPFLNVIIPKACEQDLLIETVGICCGAFDEETDWIYAHKIDLLLTGEIKHSDAVALSEERFITVGAGHFFTEICGVKKLARRLAEASLPAELAEASCQPFTIF